MQKEIKTRNKTVNDLEYDIIILFNFYTKIRIICEKLNICKVWYSKITLKLCTLRIKHPKKYQKISKKILYCIFTVIK